MASTFDRHPGDHNMLATLTHPAALDASLLPRRPTVRVRSADELRSALRQARAQALTLDGRGLDRILRLDLKEGIVEVQAATSWAALHARLAAEGLPIAAFARECGLAETVGESVSRAAPGPDGLPVSAHVAALTLVTHDGELRRADRRANPALLSLALGGQGVIGVLYSVTLSLASLRASAAAALEPVQLSIDEPKAGHETSAIELLLPPEALEAYLADLRALAAERRLQLYGISVRRYQHATEAALEWATRDWAGVSVRFGVKATLGASVAAAEFRRALLAAALRHGGAFPIHDLRDATRAQIDACYPKLAGFLAEKRRCDPAERLQNAWYRDALAIMRREACEVKWAK
jgi:FAD/FMN-containing dehydrogenase